ncbi:hypothetical protein GCM10010975_02480 [Comamonas phosphati]|nr:hypothetical protein GCM10010975_02480 [Comamonas phosphati]
MIPVQRPLGTDGQAHAMQRQGVVFTDRRQIAMGRAAGTHVVFRVDFKEADIGPRLKDEPIVVGLEADARPGGNAPPGGSGAGFRRL